MIIKQTISCIKTYIFNLILFLVFFSTALIFRFSEWPDRLINNIFFAALNAVLLQSILFIFSKTALRIPIVIFLSLFILFDISLYTIYNAPMNHSVIASIFETNFREISDIMSMIFPWGLFIFMASGLLVYKSSGEIKKMSLKKRWVPATVCVFLFFSIFILPVLLDRQDKNNPFYIPIYTYDEKIPFFQYYAEIVPVKYPLVIGDIFFAGGYFQEMAKINEYSNKIKILPNGIIYNDTLPAYDKIILIIGESANRDNFSLYGYPLKTTPFFDKMSEDTTAIFNYYDHVISPANFTRDALRMTLTYANPFDFTPFSEQKNLLNLAKDAGYSTYWISNQGRFGMYNSIMNIIAQNADTCIFTSTGKTHIDDLIVVPEIMNVLKTDEKQFIIVHLQGSHWVYDNKFDETDTKALGLEGEYIDYDKSIHHTDRVIEQIYRLIKPYDENILIYYYSDHGEVINTGHGIINEYKIQYRIPLVVIQNKPFWNMDEITGKYYDHETGLLNTSNNIYILGETMGYTASDSIIENAKVSGRYVYQTNGKYCLYNDIKN